MTVPGEYGDTSNMNPWQTLVTLQLSGPEQWRPEITGVYPRFHNADRDLITLQTAAWILIRRRIPRSLIKIQSI